MQIAAIMAISADLPVTPVLTCRNNPFSRGQEVISIMGPTDSSVSVENFKAENISEAFLAFYMLSFSEVFIMTLQTSLIILPSEKKLEK